MDRVGAILKSGSAILKGCGVKDSTISTLADFIRVGETPRSAFYSRETSEDARRHRSRSSHKDCSWHLWHPDMF